jgi:hypothetical protein
MLPTETVVKELVWRAAETKVDILKLFSESDDSFFSVRKDLQQPLRNELLAVYRGELHWAQIDIRFKDEVFSDAVVYGNLRLFTYANEKHLLPIGQISKYKEDTIANMAASNGHLNCLIYAHQNDFLIHISAAISAADKGHIDCLKYLLENCALDKSDRLISAAAAINGHLECLEYAHSYMAENFFPYVIYKTVEYGHTECLAFIHKCETARSVEWVNGLTSHAAKYRQLECLVYLYENGCLRDEFVCKEAAQAGHLECLKYAHAAGASLIGAEMAAYESSRLECLKYILSTRKVLK